MRTLYILLLLGLSGSLFAQNSCSGTQFDTVYLHKDYQDSSVVSGGWFSGKAIGVFYWRIYNYTGQLFAYMSNYDGTNHYDSEAWLVSPFIDLSGSNSPTLNFSNSASFSGSPLKLFISTDYPDQSLNPNLYGTWTDITNLATWDTDLTGWGPFLCSGDVDLSNFKGDSVTIAFKYSGTTTDGSAQEIDDIIIFDNKPPIDTTDNLLSSREEILRIYPNPFDESLTVDLSGELMRNVEIAIYNSVGKRVFVEQIINKQHSHTLSLKNLENGIYFISISNDKVRYVEKVIKSK